MTCLPISIITSLLVPLPTTTESRDSAVGVATGYGLDGQGVGVRVPIGSRIFLSPCRSDYEATQPHIQWVPGTLSPEVERSGREADHSPPTSAEVKETCVYISIPTRLHGVVLN
jgi:hypothetical protein